MKDYLNLKLMVFDLDGNIIDKKNARGDLADLNNQLFLCPSTNLDGIYAKSFGTDFTLECKINLKSFIFDRTQTKFYTLLIETSSGTFAEVPVYNAKTTGTK